MLLYYLILVGTLTTDVQLVTKLLSNSFRVVLCIYLFFHIHLAIDIDKCNVSGYFLWSLIDNFEWARGYTERFGIVKVDYERDGRDRTPKQSYHFYADLIKRNGYSRDWDTVYIHEGMTSHPGLGHSVYT